MMFVNIRTSIFSSCRRLSGKLSGNVLNGDVFSQDMAGSRNVVSGVLTTLLRRNCSHFSLISSRKSRVSTMLFMYNTTMVMGSVRVLADMSGCGSGGLDNLRLESESNPSVNYCC